MHLSERLKSVWDSLSAAAALAWTFFTALVDTAVDLLSGRQLPHPDFKSVAESPAPALVPRTRSAKAQPRSARSLDRNEAA
jgi:hypothetical protein